MMRLGCVLACTSIWLLGLLPGILMWKLPHSFYDLHRIAAPILLFLSGLCALSGLAIAVYLFEFISERLENHDGLRPQRPEAKK
jgi:hypothetical protein